LKSLARLIGFSVRKFAELAALVNLLELGLLKQTTSSILITTIADSLGAEYDNTNDDTDGDMEAQKVGNMDDMGAVDDDVVNTVIPRREAKVGWASGLSQR
jgi:hypothetical protein